MSISLLFHIIYERLKKSLTKGVTELVCVNEKFGLNEIPKEVAQAVKKEAGIA